MRQIAVLDHLLDVVGDVGSEITAPQGELPNGHLRIPNIEQHHRLDVVDVVNAEPFQLQLDDLQELTMKALDQRNHFEVEVVHCKPLVRPAFPRRWARRRLEREMCRPVYYSRRAYAEIRQKNVLRRDLASAFWRRERKIKRDFCPFM